MQIARLAKLTLIDYPGKLASTIFTPGCQLRCPFCHNAQLALTNPTDNTEHTIPEVLDYLKKRANILEAVCISGGEPLMQEKLDEFAWILKTWGYLIKLDTNGGFPTQLKRMLDLDLIDYVAMDIKNCPVKYAETCGQQNLDLTPFQETIDLLQESKIAYEFRTTVVRELHSKKDILELSKWNIGDSKLYLQSYKDSDSVLMPGLHGYNEEEMNELRQSVLPLIPNTNVRS